LIFSTFPYTLLQLQIVHMKFVVSQDLLQKKLLIVQKALSAKAQLPILATILIEAKEKNLILNTTDLEIGIQTQLAASIEKEGKTTIPARTFIELISSLPNEEIIIEEENGVLQIQSKKTKSSFQTMSADDFPKLYEEKGERVATVSAQEMKEDIQSVVFAATHDTQRPALSGVLVKREENGFLFVATDGYRLSLRHHTATSKEQSTVAVGLSWVIPARVFREITSLKEDVEEVGMYLSSATNQVIFELSETLLIGRTIEAEFPNYEKIIPSDFSTRAFIDREEMLKAVKLCAIFARESANIINLSLRKDKIIVSSQSPSVGENSVEVESELSGEENEIAFNARYLLEVLSNLEEKELWFEMTGPLNPGVFKIKDNLSFLHLIMPIRVQQ